MRTRSLFLTTLLSLGILLSGCSDSYRGERLLWRAQQKALPILQEPEKVSTRQFNDAIEAFQKVIDKTPGTLSAVKAHMAIASLYLTRKDYAKARESYAAILKNYHQYKQLSFEARVAMARSYEAENRWLEAAGAFEDIYERHPWSSIGVQVPLYIVRIYQEIGDQTKVERALERAVRLYTKQIPEAPTPVMANRVRAYLALAYQQQGNWQKAAEVLEAVIREDDPYNRPAAILSLATIREQRMNDPQGAAALYKRLDEEYPGTPFQNAARLQLQKQGAAPAPAEPGGDAAAPRPAQ